MSDRVCLCLVHSREDRKTTLLRTQQYMDKPAEHRRHAGIGEKPLLKFLEPLTRENVVQTSKVCPPFLCVCVQLSNLHDTKLMLQRLWDAKSTGVLLEAADRKQVHGLFTKVRAELMPERTRTDAAGVLKRLV